MSPPPRSPSLGTRGNSRGVHAEKSADRRNSPIDSRRAVACMLRWDKASPSHLHRSEVVLGFERETDLAEWTGL